jgi:hypothetical protein
MGDRSTTGSERGAIPVAISMLNTIRRTKSPVVSMQIHRVAGSLPEYVD